MEVTSSAGPMDDRAKNLFLALDPILIPRFYPILQAGVFVKARTGESVSRLLCGEWELSAEYVRQKISTVFLDGKPVDDIDAAAVKEGSTLALSSAMPGLVGATMRRQGFYASFRGTITHREEGERPQEKEGFFRVKLFNILMAELAPLLLGRGVYLPCEEMTRFLRDQPDRFFDGCREVGLDGQPMDVSSLRETGWCAGQAWVRARVCESP